MITDLNGVILLINPAAAAMIGYEAAEAAIGLNFTSVVRFENGEGLAIEEGANVVLLAIRNAQAFQTRDYVLVSIQDQRRPVAITVTPVGERVILTFRDIASELEREGSQTEFISTASHEMRTPVASIEGYLGLALNPQTATIDARARQYLEEAHASSQHLGRLFQELLDVTKLDDKKLKVRMVPIEVSEVVHEIVKGQVPMMQQKNITYSFGANDPTRTDRHLEQAVYASVDVDFLREVMNNLVENAVKYTPQGGSVWVGVRGEGDVVLINVTDTGIGISPEDLKHIFQKFYRADNSQTREIGGTGLGLYLVKERVEAMGGKVWAESIFGQGSTFYVSFPRLTGVEYERRKQILINQEAMKAPASNLQPPSFSPAS